MTAPKDVSGTVAAMKITDVLWRAAELLDNVPVAPNQLAKRAVASHLDKSVERAASDPEWAEIEARRDTGRSGSKLLLSEEHDLTFEHLKQQWDIERALTPDPWWMSAAHTLTRCEATRGLLAVEHRWQRAQRGFSHRDNFNGGRHLVRVAAGMLKELAENSYSWPGDDEFPTYEAWVSALRTHADVLDRYLNDPKTHDLQSSALEATGEERSKLWKQEGEREAQNLADAQASMRWVADHIHLIND